MIPDFDSIAHLINDPVRQKVAKAAPHESASFLSSFGRVPVYTRPEMETIKHLSDARRVEAAILPAMCFEIVSTWKCTTLFDTQILKEDFTTAIEQLILGHTERRATKLSIRILETAQKLLHGRLGGYFHEEKGLTLEKIAMVLYCLACDMTADGTFELVEGSVMHRALENMKTAALKELVPKQVASAERRALKFREFLAERKFFVP